MKRLLLVITLAGVLSGTALAGEMPGVGKSVMSEVPTVGSTSTTGEANTVSPPPVPGEMPGAGSATLSETESSLVTTVLLTIITFLGR
jgi:hypothetical protein